MLILTIVLISSRDQRLEIGVMAVSFATFLSMSSCCGKHHAKQMREGRVYCGLWFLMVSAHNVRAETVARWLGKDAEKHRAERAKEE